ncbi:MAG: NUDIX domain-containing protein [Pseudomonadota bacterium]
MNKPLIGIDLGGTKIELVGLDASGAVLLRRRPERGLLGGMMEVPSSDWRTRRWVAGSAVGTAPVLLPRSCWRALPGAVRHTFTHFQLELQVVAANLDRPDGVGGVWAPVDRLSEHALPSLMKKVMRHVAAHGG